MDTHRHFAGSRANWVITAASLIMVIIVLAACAGGGSLQAEPMSGVSSGVENRDASGETYADEVYPAAQATMPPPATAGPGYYPVEESDLEAEAPLDSDSAGAAPQSGADDTTASTEGQPSSAGPQNAMIIKNGEMSLLVENADVAIDRTTQIATDAGGYVISSQVWFSGEYKLATITLGVPSDQFETAMRRLREIAMEVLAESSSGQDVSAEYVDLQSRLRNLEATRDRIMGFLDEAKTVEEALLINQTLAGIEAEIEQVRGRMNYLEGRAAYSTITVNIEVPRPTPTPTPTPTNTPTPTPTFTPTATATATPWAPGQTFTSAVQTQTGLLRGLVEALIWLGVVIGPWLLVIGVVAVGANALRRRINGNGRRGGPTGGSQPGGSGTGGTPQP